ncbi:MAG: hypothetical protein ABIU11_02515, partial [Chitinophagaceae bacterium]
MKKTIALLSLSLFLLMGIDAHAQKLNEWLKTKKDEAKSKVNSKVDKKSSEGIDNALNKPEEAIKKKKEEKKDKKNEKKGSSADTKSNNNTDNLEANSSKENNTEAPNGKKAGSLQFYSKFDFVPGETIVAIDDFSQDAMGDFPGRWNTNSSGDLVNVEGKPGKWLSLSKEGVLTPEFFNKFPDNFTLQFELMCNPDVSFYSAPFGLAFVKLAKPQNFTDWTYHGHITGGS